MAKNFSCLLLGILLTTGAASEASGSGSATEIATHLLPTRLPKGYQLVKPEIRRYPSTLRDDGLTTQTLLLANGLELSAEIQRPIGPVGSENCPSQLGRLGEVDDLVVYKSSEIVPSIEPYARQIAYYCPTQTGTPTKLTIQGGPAKAASFREVLKEYVTPGGLLPAGRTFSQTLLINFDLGVARYRFGSRSLEFRVQRCKPTRLMDQTNGTFVQLKTGRGVFSTNTLFWRPEPDVCATVLSQALNLKQLATVADSARPVQIPRWETATGKWSGDFPNIRTPP